MRLVSFTGGFGRVEADHVVPMGDDIVAFLRDGSADDADPVPLAELQLRAPVPAPG